MRSPFKFLRRYTILAALCTVMVPFASLLPAAQAQSNTETLTLSSETNAVEAVDVTTLPGVGSVFTITVSNSGLVNGTEAVSYTSVSGDTPATVASDLVNAINADTNLSSNDVTATLGTGPNFTITSTSANPTYYTGTATFPTGAVAPAHNPFVLSVEETLALSGTVNSGDVISLTVYNASLNGGKETVSVTAASGNKIGDIRTALENAINADTNLSALDITAASGLVIKSPTYSNLSSITSYSVTTTGAEKLILGDFYGTNGIQTVTVGGTITPGNVLSLYAFDSFLSAGQEEVQYAVQKGDTKAKVACSLATAVNADTALAYLNISATCSGNIIALNSESSDSTYWSLQASVQPSIQCVLAVPGSQSYPSNAVKYCYSINDDVVQLQADAQTVLSTVINLENNNAYPGGKYAAWAANLMKANHNYVLYVYANPSEFAASADYYGHPTGGPSYFWPSIALKLTSNTLAYSIGTEFRSATVLFESASNGSTNIGVFPHATAHEFGHQVDGYYGPAKSLSQQYTTYFNTDLYTSQNTPPCTYDYLTGATNPDGTPNYNFASGWFTEEYDDNVNLICTDPAITGPPPQPETPITGTLNAPYSGTNNQTTLEAAYPSPFWANEVFATGNTFTPASEIFAESFAANSGYTDQSTTTNSNGTTSTTGADPGLSVGFDCSYYAEFAYSLYGSMPVDSSTDWNYTLPVPFGSVSVYVTNIINETCNQVFAAPGLIPPEPYR